MDAFGDLLRDVRADGAVLGGSVLTPPWALRFADGAPLTLCTLLRGEGWILDGADAPRRIGPGDTAIVRGPEPFVVADAPASAASSARVRDARSGAAAPPLGWDAEPGPTALVTAAYRARGEVCDRLVCALPRILVQPGDCEGDAVLQVIAAEVATDLPGRQVVVDRLLDWLLVCTLRTWFDGPDAQAPGWYRALADPVVGPALRAIHDDPSRSWTVASLAGVAGVSRAALAKRFTTLVGEPPMAYLAGWRMTLAADLLARGDLTLAAVARRVGYADGFSFSTAFTRIRGQRPTAYRTALVSG